MAGITESSSNDGGMEIEAGVLYVDLGYTPIDSLDGGPVEFDGLSLAFFDAYTQRDVASRLNGLAINLYGDHGNTDLNGVGIGLCQFYHNMTGLQVGGWNGAGQNMTGVQIGLGNGAGQDMTGVQIGLGNVAVQDMTGVQVGFGQAAGQDMTGLQVGILQKAGQDMTGLQVGGSNGAREDMTGVQVGILFNMAQSMRGLQLSLLGSVSEESCGLQVGLYNAAMYVFSSKYRETHLWFCPEE